MKLEHFISIDDVSDPARLVKQVIKLKAKPNRYSKLGRRRSLALLFFNPSLRTRLSTQRAAQLLGMEQMLMDVNNGWPLEFGKGVVMDQNTSEHVIEAAGVISQYCDILSIRSFPSLQSQEADYEEPVMSAFKEFGTRPIINLESATRHPLQGLTDMVTIAEHKKTKKPKVVLTWAPHPKALPQSVANSFAAWTLAMGHHLTITHPPGYELATRITDGATIEYDPEAAYKDADFVYAKNWSAYKDYGQVLSSDKRWTVDQEKMNVTNQAFFMHCLPVRRNVVVTDQIIGSDRSLILQQANNRTYAAAIILKILLQSMNK